jgi:hypothetical protein
MCIMQKKTKTFDVLLIILSLKIPFYYNNNQFSIAKVQINCNIKKLFIQMFYQITISIVLSNTNFLSCQETVTNVSKNIFKYFDPIQYSIE